MRSLLTYLRHFTLAVVALQLLNLSINTQDFKPLYTGNVEQEINITETISEYVVEVLLGHTNAIPEQVEHRKDLHLHKHGSFKCICFYKEAFNKDFYSHISTAPVPRKESLRDLYQGQVDPQPPKA